jgi:DNA anti-recombination protein RmuC
VAGTLAAMITTMAATQEQRLAQIGREQATRLEAIRRETKGGRWRR